MSNNDKTEMGKRLLNRMLDRIVEENGEFSATLKTETAQKDFLHIADYLRSIGFEGGYGFEVKPDSLTINIGGGIYDQLQAARQNTIAGGL